MTFDTTLKSFATSQIRYFIIIAIGTLLSVSVGVADQDRFLPFRRFRSGILPTALLQ